MAQNPNILTVPAGPQFLTAPDGTVENVPATIFTPEFEVDLTGTPLTAAPNREGAEASIDSNPAGNQLVISGLYNVTDDDVGAAILLDGTEIDVVASPPVAPNSGIFIIDSVSPPNIVTATKFQPVPPNVMFPDEASGHIRWALIRTEQLPQGDPLTYVANAGIPTTVNTPASGPARFADYNPEQPPLVVNDSAGVFGRVQST